jgi:hypothetical protein
LRHTLSGRSFELVVEQVLGRATSAGIVIESPKASALHAELRWVEGYWELHDLGSRNGTFVGNRRLEAGERARLSEGERVSFGDPLDEWKLVDARAPSGRSATARLAETEQEYAPSPKAAELELAFTVSKDEEHVSVVARHAGGVTELPASNLHYLLLVLARQRLRDRERADLGADEQGWLYVDELCSKLRLDPSHLNVTIFRLRKQLEKLGVVDAAGIVERRRTTGQVRIGVSALSIRAREGA